METLSQMFGIPILAVILYNFQNNFEVIVEGIWSDFKKIEEKLKKI